MTRFKKDRGERGKRRSATPTRGQFRKGVELGEEQTYIGRGPFPKRSKWANPFPTSKFPRTEAIRRFAQHVRESLLASEVEELAGQTLMCHCAPHLPCHADVLIEEFRARRSEASDCDQAFLKVGVPWEPEEFLQEALKAEHPFEAPPPLPDCTVALIFKFATRGREAVQLERKKNLDHYARVAKELQAQEDSLKEQADPHVRAIVASKKILLFKKMLEDCEHPDTSWLGT